MKYHKKNLYSLKESEATPESEYRSESRRNLLKKGLALALAGYSGTQAFGKKVTYSFLKSPVYEESDDLKITDSELTTKYNNFYEFSLDKERVHVLAKNFQTNPWEIEIGGLVDKPMKMECADLVKKFQIEQRVYRLRCVEKWAAVIPWEGFSLSKLVEMVSPKPEAKFVRFVSFNKPGQALGQRSLVNYPWPYTEGLRIDEAMHNLSFLAVGAYGKPLLNQNGAPIRLVVPWKYGFKSVKSITKIEFVDKMPSTLWNTLAPGEYGFYANVNPKVSHPRWSQMYEKPLGSWFSSRKSRLFNGYDEVAELYAGMDLRKNY